MTDAPDSVERLVEKVSKMAPEIIGGYPCKFCGFDPSLLTDALAAVLTPTVAEWQAMLATERERYATLADVAKSQMASLEADLSAVRERYAKLEGLYRVNLELLQGMQERYAKLEAGIADLQSRFDREAKDRLSLLDEWDEAQEKIAKLEAENARLRSQLKEKTFSIEDGQCEECGHIGYFRCGECGHVDGTPVADDEQ